MRYRNYIYSGIVFFIIISSAIAFNSIKVVTNSEYEEPPTVVLHSLILPDATISLNGNSTVCQNGSTPPQIIFTGSGGVRPYTFTYNINSGSSQTMTTIGSNDSVSIFADISVVGTFTYSLSSVEDGRSEERRVGNECRCGWCPYG